ncbi:neutral/alkaline non-lysosomal ceramidase N-terminal domain-containing protein [Stieleria varia]|uniref:Neutral/alkaline non-lysosomal ceramidase n=1 Tax=Stieleria varia TaxID=2528005 RepID=A0A5C6B904_9BACT|nr:neutral/alkaline non-lysosomal ceramidase N-terminal domain-containing protein [Stieleria varia]TWU07746.1 Neutral/alkaline non-lysosomal ceramidase [Stieleria varia]
MLTLTAKSSCQAELRVGAAVVDVNPTQMPVIVNGGMLSRTATQIRTTVNARAIVLADDKTRIAIVVVDSCMMPRLLLDDAKQLAASKTAIPAENMLISATHTHTAPSSFGALGTPADLNYLPVIRQRIVEAIVAAESNLQPARVGWGSTSVPEMTALRRWVRRPDKLDVDPFGEYTVRANMHAATKMDMVTGPTGPEDPELSMIAFETLDGAPIAILANYSMHYFGDQPISADYFGLFSESIAKHAGERFQTKHPDADPPTSIVGVLSHGCSGDIWRRDYWTYNGKDDQTIEGYAQAMAGHAAKVYDGIEYQSDADLRMVQSELPMRYRVPNESRLKWAQQIVAEMGDRQPKDKTEVYAREAVLLHEMQETKILVQALRIGDIAIATTPNETYALTGLKLKHQSPLNKTMVIELANGADGYIPPPEQHPLGGYNTWPARSAGLEVSAESKIVAALLTGLEDVTGKPRRPFVQSVGKKTQAILDHQPVLYWRCDAMDATVCRDQSGNQNDGKIDPGVLFFLPGPKAADAENQFCVGDEVNRCMHFADGRVSANIDRSGNQWSAVVSVWNGMPLDARSMAGWFLSRDGGTDSAASKWHAGVAGTEGEPGVLAIKIGDNETVYGKTPLERWQWYQIAIVCDGEKLRVHINGQTSPEIETEITAAANTTGTETWSLGGNTEMNWEGRLDEFALFDKAFTPTEINNLLQ